jgi:Family of unknown function (DUF6236)
MMLGSALYYPYIDINDPQWLRSAILFWDEIKTIVPRAIRDPYKDKDTRILWKEGFLEPLRCDLHSDLLERLGQRVVTLMDRNFLEHDIPSESRSSDPNASTLLRANKFGTEIKQQFRRARIHPEKMSPQLRALAMRAGLARIHPEKLPPNVLGSLRAIASGMQPAEMSPHLLRLLRNTEQIEDDDGEWLLLDSRFADVYMSALAALLAKETDLAALTNEEPAMGVNLHTLLEDVKDSEQSGKKGALVSFVMEAIRVDPTTHVDKLLKFRRSRKTQLAELSAQFEDISSKISSCETAKELKEKAGDTYKTKVKPKLDSLKDELNDNSIGAVWDGMQRAVTISVPAGGALAYFTGLTGTTLLTAGAAIAVTDIAVKAYLARKKTRRASPYSYLLDLERKFSVRNH